MAAGRRRQNRGGSGSGFANALNAHRSESPSLQRHHLRAHRLQQHATHLAGLVVHGLGGQQSSKPSAETICWHGFGITEVSELAVVEPMNGRHARAIPRLLTLTHNHLNMPVDVFVLDCGIQAALCKDEEEQAEACHSMNFGAAKPTRSFHGRHSSNQSKQPIRNISS